MRLVSLENFVGKREKRVKQQFFEEPTGAWNNKIKLLLNGPFPVSFSLLCLFNSSKKLMIFYLLMVGL